MNIWFDIADDAPSDASLLAIPFFESDDLTKDAGAGIDVAFLTVNGFEGKTGEVRLLPGDNASTVLVFGVGPRDSASRESFRKAGAAARRNAGRHGHVAVVSTAAPTVSAAEAMGAFVEGFCLAGYRFDGYKKIDPDKASRTERVTVVGPETESLQKAVDRAVMTTTAVALARDLVNEPAGVLAPEDLAARALEAADRVGIDCVVRDQSWIDEHGLGGLAGVAAGSVHPPVLLELTYEPGSPAQGHVVLVGKGVTFDSGGLSLKQGEGMTTMKCDMAGAAAVIAAMTALPALNPSVKVTALVPVAENMPSGGALKPGDVLRTRNGTTVEVLNTDAEGRLLLADALALASELEPDAIVDIATLTGAQITALGREVAAVMGTDDALVEQVLRAGEGADEPMWRLPLADRYRSDLDSRVADLKNIGGPAGTVMAGLFLREFAGDTPWAHIDIAGPAWTECDTDYRRPGATGFGVRALLGLLSCYGEARSEQPAGDPSSETQGDGDADQLA